MLLKGKYWVLTDRTFVLKEMEKRIKVDLQKEAAFMTLKNNPYIAQIVLTTQRRLSPTQKL